MTEHHSFPRMLTAVPALHDKHDFRNTGGEELVYRVALLAEAAGEISACVTRGKPVAELAGECADLLILLPGTAIAASFGLADDCWRMMEKPEQRGSRRINGRIRVSGVRYT